MSAATAIPIFTNQDFYVPAFQVKLQGRPAGQEIINDILQVTYKDDIEQVDSFDITINNWDADTLDFKYSDGDLFNPGKKLELWMGYYGADPLLLMIKGEITSLTPNFPSSGQPTLSISGLNLLHQLRKKQESHQYQNLTDSQIAQQVVGRTTTFCSTTNSTSCFSWSAPGATATISWSKSRDRTANRLRPLCTSVLR